MHFIDSHAHINDEAFDADRAETLQSCFAAGVGQIFEIGCQPQEWQQALDLADTYPGQIYPVLGLHPEAAPLFTPAAAKELAALLLLPQVKAVGEIGLDYAYTHVSPKDTQHAVLDQLFTLANQAKKPLVLHVRRTEEDYSVYTDFFAALRARWTPAKNARHPGVLHCFCARYEEAKQALDQGLLLGINGCFTYKKNEYIREAIKKAGADKIVLETDCPYLSPQGKRGERNSPLNIPLLAQYVADYLDLPVAELARLTTLNAQGLYGIDKNLL